MRQMFSEKQIVNLITNKSLETIKKAIKDGEISNVLFETTNIKNLSDDECNSLKVGDMVIKNTGNQKHLYIVTYKEANQGLCLSYFDASTIETQSYDYTDGHWVYNSEDKTKFIDIGELIDISSGLQSGFTNIYSKFNIIGHQLSLVCCFSVDETISVPAITNQGKLLLQFEIPENIRSLIQGTYLGGDYPRFPAVASLYREANNFEIRLNNNGTAQTVINEGTTLRYEFNLLI